MDITTFEGYPVPLPTDPAAGGGQIEAYARAGDARYGGTDADSFSYLLANEYVRQPTLIQRRTTAQTAIVLNTDTRLTGLSTVDFNNRAVTTQASVIDLGAFFPPTMAPAMRLWHVGFCAGFSTATPLAGVDLQMWIKVDIINPFSSTVETQYIRARERGEHPAVNQPVWLAASDTLLAYSARLTWFFRHDNTTNYQMDAGAFAWATLVSPLPITP